jgi:hypothetical protein
MPLDDGVRSSTGVVASLAPTANGKMRLVFDDAESDRESNPTAWTPRALFSSKEFDAVQLRSLKLSESELARIGENLLIRLLALGESAR